MNEPSVSKTSIYKKANEGVEGGQDSGVTATGSEGKKKDVDAAMRMDPEARRRTTEGFAAAARWRENPISRELFDARPKNG